MVDEDIVTEGCTERRRSVSTRSASRVRTSFSKTLSVCTLQIIFSYVPSFDLIHDHPSKLELLWRSVEVMKNWVVVSRLLSSFSNFFDFLNFA